MTERDAVLRAHVFAAFDVRDDPAVLREACERIVYVDAIWPAVEWARAIERADEALAEQRARDDAELLGWYASLDALDLFGAETACAA